MGQRLYRLVGPNRLPHPHHALPPHCDPHGTPQLTFPQVVFSDTIIAETLHGSGPGGWGRLAILLASLALG